MDLKTLEYMETRVNAAKKITKEIEDLKAYIGGLSRLGFIPVRAYFADEYNNGVSIHNKNVSETIQNKTIEVLEQRIVELEAELAEL